MKKLLRSHNGASKGAALILVLGIVVIASALGLAYFTRTTTNRQLAQTSYNDTTADLLARSALDIVVGNLKQEITTAGSVTPANVQPQRSGDDPSIPNLIRRSVRNDPIPSPPGVPSLASSISSTSASANGRSISAARWNSHYLIPPGVTFTAPDWVLVTGQGPNSAPAAGAVIGRYAFAVYDEGGLIPVNMGGFPTYAGLTVPTLPGRPAPPARKMAPKYPSEESEIMLAAFTPNGPCNGNGNNAPPNFTPQVTNVVLATGVPVSLLFNTNHNPDSFGASFLPAGLSINTTNGNITGAPTDPGGFTITLTATNECGTGTGTLNLLIEGFSSPDSTPWPVNLARKGTIAFADLTALPSAPTTAQINKIMGWRNYATTQQSGASFNSPSFPNDLTHTEYFARYFLGAIPPFTSPFTTVPIAVSNSRTDQAVMTRQELIRLQRQIGFSQSLLQYLGTFSREYNRPAASWPGLSGALSGGRWDMNNLEILLPDSWIGPGNHGQGHAYGRARHSDIGRLFGLVWINGTFTPGTRTTDPNYYGHWKYIHNLSGSLPDDPDFFQVIDYATTTAIGVNNPNHVQNTFKIGAALIDQFDGEDVYDPDPNAPCGGNCGNTITVIDPVGNGNTAQYVYGIETMSFDDPLQNQARPGLSYCPYPPMLRANYPFLNRRFENIGEFGYAYSPLSALTSQTLDFTSAASNDKALLDFFTFNTASVRDGIVNLNTRNGPVLASILRGAWVQDPGGEATPPPVPPPTTLVSQTDALAAAQAIVTATSAANGAAVTRADVARLAAAAAAAVPNLAGSDQAKKTVARALAETGKARTWNVMIDVIAHPGNYAPGTPDLTDPTKFIVQGEKRYWLHIALDRDDRTVLGSQLEEVTEQ
jgi:hypothetical protein